VLQLYAHDPFPWLQGLLWADSPASDWLWLSSTWACTGWGMTALALLFTWWRGRGGAPIAGAPPAWWRGGRAGLLLWRTLPAFASLLLAGIVANAVKLLVWAPRPQAKEAAALLEPGTFHVLEVIRGHGSFPSGHSASAAALATWALLRFGWRGWPLLALGILGGLSRVAVGAHWTVDVLGGWTVGALGAIAVRAVERRLETRRAAKAA
jgi:membrane-associated phospholipid phosphatase